MTTSTSAPHTRWTIDSLHDYLLALIRADQRFNDERFAASKEAVHSALASAKEAVTKAETATSARFDSVNEFRATLSDQAHSFMPRGEFEAQHLALFNRIDDIERRYLSRDVLGRSEYDASRHAHETLHLALAKRLDEIQARLDRAEGSGSGLRAGWGYLVSALALLASLLAVFLSIYHIRG